MVDPDEESEEQRLNKLATKFAEGRQFLIDAERGEVAFGTTIVSQACLEFLAREE